MLEWLKKLLNEKRNRINELQTRSNASNDLNEVRMIGETVMSLNEEIRGIEEQISALEKNGSFDPETDPQNPANQRSGVPVNAPVNPAGIPGNVPLQAIRGAAFAVGHETKSDAPYSSIEYRNAFKAYVQRGELISEELLKRAGGDAGPTVTDDIGIIIPVPIMNEFIKEVSKVYGNIYAKVRKLNVKGGIKFPISKLKANFKWITETTVSEGQKAGDIKDYIQFDYNIGEIRVTETLLAQIVSLDQFESDIVRIMVEAYMEAMDKGIISGTGEGQLLGITKDPRVTNTVEFTDAEFSDWTAWRKKLFAKIPLSMRGKGEFLFSASTVETYLLTMKDKNDRPLFREATDLSMGMASGKFFGRNVDLVEADVIADFDTAAAGDVIGIFWNPGDYGINTNMQFGMKRYFDDDRNEWVNKALTIVDGKMIDPKSCYLLKKKTAA